MPRARLAIVEATEDLGAVATVCGIRQAQAIRQVVEPGQETGKLVEREGVDCTVSVVQFLGVTSTVCRRGRRGPRVKSRIPRRSGRAANPGKTRRRRTPRRLARRASEPIKAAAPHAWCRDDLTVRCSALRADRELDAPRAPVRRSEYEVAVAAEGAEGFGCLDDEAAARQGCCARC